MAYLVPDRIYIANGVTVKEYFLTRHNPNNIALPGKRILSFGGYTVHNTDPIKVSSKTTMAEQYTRATYNGNMGDVRVHFYVDAVEAWQNLPLDWQSWHAGSKKNGKGEPEANGSHIGNQATISIEVIGSSAKAEENAARLIAYLMKSSGMGTDYLYTHNYWVNVRRGRTGTIDVLNKTSDGYKGCPAYIRPHWDSFRTQVEKYLDFKAEKDVLYRVQVGAFHNKSNAEIYLKSVQKYFPDAFITKEG